MARAAGNFAIDRHLERRESVSHSCKAISAWASSFFPRHQFRSLRAAPWTDHERHATAISTSPPLGRRQSESLPFQRSINSARFQQLLETAAGLGKRENVAIVVTGAVEIGDRDRYDIDALEEVYAACLLKSVASLKWVGFRWPPPTLYSCFGCGAVFQSDGMPCQKALVFFGRSR